MTIRAGIATSLAIIFSCLPSTGAKAGQYTIHNCPGSLQPNFDAGPWQEYTTTPLPGAGGFQGSCTPGSALGTAIGWYANVQNLNSNLGVTLQSPSPTITIRSLRLVWSVSHQSSGSDTYAQVITDTGSALIDPTPYAASAGAPTQLNLPTGTHAVYVYSYCSYDNSTHCYFPSNTSAVIKLEGMDTTLEDNDPPNATVTGGALAGNGPVSGTSTLQFTAADPESGVREAQLLVDGAAAISHSNSSVCPYTNFAACPNSEVDSMTWDTSAVPSGEHVIALRITDAAGNSRVVDEHTIQVANSTASGSLGVPSVNIQSCTAAAGTHTAITVTAKHDLIRSRYERRARLRGSLIGPGRRPVNGAAVEVLAKPVVGSAIFSSLGHVTTRANGQFKLMLPRGLSRTICLRYRPLPEGHYTAALLVSDKVSAGVTLAVHPRRIESNGTIILTGRVLGGYLSQAGKVVELQVLYLGRWRVFETVRSSPDGQYTYFYGFIGGRGAFAFRARVRGENGYPYALGYSPPVTVRAG